MRTVAKFYLFKMKRFEIKEFMEKGSFYSLNWGVKCKVLHLFKHRTWISYNGKIKSIPHKYISYCKLKKGPSTYSTHGRLSVENSKNVINDLLNKYKQ